MLKNFLLLTIISFSTMLHSQNYELQWAEEFEGELLNENIWNFEKGLGKNYEEQFYTGRNKNFRIENGMLVIEAHKEDYHEAQYTSARLNTLDKKHFRYGKIEVRAKLPEGNGTWTAIWILGSNHKSAGYPACGEIDILEHVGKLPNEVHGAVHFPDKKDEKMISDSEFSMLSPSEDGFHLYSMEWDREEIRFFVDGFQFHRFKIDDANRFGRKNPFRKPFYLIVNLALGGRWAGEIDNSIFPVQFYIDYIRYYKLKNSGAD